MKSQKEKLVELLLHNGIYVRKSCSVEEDNLYAEMNINSKLPPYVYISELAGSKFCKIIKPDITDEELKLLIYVKQLDYIKTIKNYVVFFVISFIILVFVAFYIKSMSFTF